MTASNKLYRRIADAIAEAIESGAYKVGDRLPTERELAEQFGVSRPTLREAMIALEMLGMVEARHGLGIYVTGGSRPMTTSWDFEIGAFELIEARRLFEGEAAALAATTIDDEDLAELERLLALMTSQEEIKGEDADRDFHLLIARATGNGAIAATVENLWELRNRSPLARNILVRARGLGLEPRANEHRRVLDALRARDPVAARQAMRDHLERVIEHLLHATETEALQKAQQETTARRSAIAKRVAI
ncbi:FadR/GntR family transcriptional regulator [Caulobacter sp. NIBR2454]|uniref:FadR/GntR family transcriptional regulator n=1 Tax=Caulobacter sp. NIBR2454 TaxID=3015996 RepID=UPI0022B6142E|nr:FadR/GntR family transcriptional regulator [Caulobacter sp. NIBR2454]